MTADEFLRMQEQQSTRKRPSDDEHRIQVACVRWFKQQYPFFAHNLFAVPNGGRRDAVTGARLKAEGVLAGVADLILLKPNRFYGALLIEMKTRKGKQQQTQREWQQKIIADGYHYVICRSFDDFRREVNDYIAYIP